MFSPDFRTSHKENVKIKDFAKLFKITCFHYIVPWFLNKMSKNWKIWISPPKSKFPRLVGHSPGEFIHAFFSWIKFPCPPGQDHWGSHSSCSSKSSTFFIAFTDIIVQHFQFISIISIFCKNLMIIKNMSIYPGEHVKF